MPLHMNDPNNFNNAKNSIPPLTKYAVLSLTSTTPWKEVTSNTIHFHLKIREMKLTNVSIASSGNRISKVGRNTVGKTITRHDFR